ncbi:hemicentin-1-like [Xenentodon cancila]
MPSKPAPIKKSPAKKAVEKAPEPAPEPEPAPAPVEAPAAPPAPAEDTPAEGSAPAAAPAAEDGAATPTADATTDAAPAEAAVVEEPPKAPTPPPAVPASPPVDVSVDDVNDSSLSIKWKNPETTGDSGLDGYTVEYCKDGTTDWVVANEQLTLANRFCIKNLTAGDLLHVRVVAVNPGGRSEPGALAQPVLIREIVDRPRIRLPRYLKSRYVRKAGEQINLVIPFVGKPKPVVSWLKDGQPVDTKRVNIRNTDRDSILFIRSSQREDSGVYEITLKVDSFEDKATITLQIVELPGPPASIKLVDSWGFNAALEWTPPKDNGNAEITGYTVQKADKKTGEWFTVLEHYHRVTATISDLIMGNSYSFRVFSENLVGRSEASAVTKNVAKVQKTGINYKPPEYQEHVFTEAPKFTTPLIDHATTVGYTTKLLCAVRGCPKPKIEWMKNQMIIGDDPKFRQISNQGICSLEIRKPSSFDGGVYTCRAKNEQGEAVVSCKLEVKLPPVPVVQLMSAEWDVFLTENVKLSCSIEGSSDWTFKWLKGEQELQEDSGSSFPGNGSVLTITGVAETQSGAYTCKGVDKTKGVSTKISNPFNIKVNDLPKATLKPLTPWLDVFENEAVNLSCDVSKSGWVVAWYRDKQKLDVNGEHLDITSASQSHQGEYSCKAVLMSRGISSHLSNTATVKVHASKPKPKLSRVSNFNQMYPGESITFTCVVDVSSGWEYVWYHSKKEISVPSSNTFTIPSLSLSNSGDYHCKAKRGQTPFYTEDSDVLSLQVSDPPTPILTQLTHWSDVFENEEVKFRCEVSSPDWTFTWFRDKVKLDDEGSVFSIASVSQSHQGEYSCKANLASRRVSSDFSKTATVKVYASKPKPKLSRDSNLNQMYPGESITFTCVVDVSSGWEYVWYHSKKEISAPSSNTFTIPSLSLSNSGDYHCKAKRGQTPFYTEDSDVLSLQVSDPPTPILTQLTHWSDVFENEEVKFRCEVSSPDWTFTWFRDKVKLDDEGSVFSIASVSQSHQGEYSCKANLASRRVSSDFSKTATVKVYEKLPTPTLKKNPDFNIMYIGEEVTFSCNVDVSSGWEYHWYKDENNLGKSGDALSIKLNPSDRGSYFCKASRGNTSTGHSEKKRQAVEDIPVPSLKPVTPWLDVFREETVKLRCEILGSSGWRYTWYRNGEIVLGGNRVAIDAEGITLSINSIFSSLGGNYSCSAILQDRSVRSNFSSSVTLDVYDAAPIITLVQNPDYNLMHTDDSVSFSCEVSKSSGWDYLWYKDGKLLSKPGKSHVYNITSVVKTDTGSYECKVQRGVDAVYYSDKSKDAKIEVQERPQASIILQTDWSEVFSTDSLLLKCEVVDSDAEWNYTWFREGEQVELSSEKSEKFTVTPQNDPAQSQYTCKGIRNERPLYSKSSDSFKTKNLLLKRRILLSISGCLFFGIIAVLLGCIFLRVFRKPAPADENPDEDNLFLTMAQLKDCTDAPNPLAAYITDTDLNTPLKEADDNGTICSETTPLPITSQEDQAVTTGSHGTTENGAGMVSFHT